MTRRKQLFGMVSPKFQGDVWGIKRYRNNPTAYDNLSREGYGTHYAGYELANIIPVRILTFGKKGPFPDYRIDLEKCLQSNDDTKLHVSYIEKYVETQGGHDEWVRQ